jgi:hypothetical protein
MSLAMYAATIDDEPDQLNDDNIRRKRASNNKTQKQYSHQQQSKEDITSNKVMSVLQTIHNLPEQRSDFVDFNPLSPPSSSGVENTKLKDNIKNNSSNIQNSLNNNSISSNLQKNNYSSFIGSVNDSEENNDYYKRFIPNYEEIYKPVSSQQSQQSQSVSSYYNNMNPGMMNPMPKTHNIQANENVLIEKLNYMIHLLEEQQDEKTNNITEEVILYSFLGIFVIFIVDSFTKVGKYTR